MNKKKLETIAEKLNTLLACYGVHYQNLRALHWNIKGENFFDLHIKYEELYNSAQKRVDAIAERILGYQINPFHSYADFIKNSSLKENEYISDGKKGMQYIVDAQDEIIKLAREIFAISDEENDEGTSSLMSDVISDLETKQWMFRAWLGK